MYRGYNLEGELNLNRTCYDFSKIQYFKSQGKSQFDKMKLDVAKILEEFINCDGVIDATKLQNNWFPNVKADIFLSHSHRDFDNACILAGLLNDKFGLTVFIDSCIWGNYTNILRQIDDKYCFNSSSKTYDYDIRNKTTSHVHMMLANALSMMIYNTECLFFLNTPNSISFKSTVSDKTLSPWIYHEMIASKYLRQSKLNRVTTINEGVNLSYDKDIKVTDSIFNAEYDLSTDHLIKISLEKLIGLIDLRYSFQDNKYSFLDSLYERYKLNAIK